MLGRIASRGLLFSWVVDLVLGGARFALKAFLGGSVVASAFDSGFGFIVVFFDGVFMMTMRERRGASFGDAAVLVSWCFSTPLLESGVPEQ